MHAVQVVESAKANGTNNHGLDGNRLFVGVSCAAGSPASTAGRQPVLAAVMYRSCICCVTTLVLNGRCTAMPDSAVVNKAAMVKRTAFHARGKTGMIHKRRSHLTVGC